MVMGLSKPHLSKGSNQMVWNPISNTHIDINTVDSYVKRNVYIAFGIAYEPSQPITLMDEVELSGSIVLDLDNPPTHYFLN